MWMTRMYVCEKPNGKKLIEKSRFKVGENTKPRSGRRAGTIQRKQDANDRDYIKRLARTINCNFGYGDKLVTLEYSNEQYEKLIKSSERTEQTVYSLAKTNVERLLRRVRDALAKEALPFLYICMTSETDPDSDEATRVHHHLLIQGAAYETVKRLWKYGFCEHAPLRDQDDYTAIAEYLAAQAPREKDAKKHTASRNLKKPKIRETVDPVRRELRAPSGSTLLYKSEYNGGEGEFGSCQYIRYVQGERKKRSSCVNRMGLERVSLEEGENNDV